MKHLAYLFLLAGLLLLGASSSQVASAAPLVHETSSIPSAAPVVENVTSINNAAPTAQGCSGAPSIQFAYANPSVISVGQVTTLFWGLVGNANAAFLQYPNGQREGIGTPGSKQVNPTQTSTYFIVGACGGVETSLPIVVTVNSAPGCNGAPQLNGFTANPPTIQAGQSSTLAWGAVLNAQSVQLSSQTQGGSGVPAPGSVQVNPTQTTTYYLTAWCQANSVQAQVTVTVTNPPPPPPPSSGSRITGISKNGGLTNANRLVINVIYFWDGQDAPAHLQARAFNSSGGQVGMSNATNIRPNSEVNGNLQFEPYPQGMSSVTACIVGSSGTELVCSSTGMQ
ncbi:MAG: hypothetical protein IT331_14235 [Anaerolineae bacterium]|nr:hypothetical protein [Anaerolineae bacterium]